MHDPAGHFGKMRTGKLGRASDRSAFSILAEREVSLSHQIVGREPVLARLAKDIQQKLVLVGTQETRRFELFGSRTGAPEQLTLTAASAVA